MIFNKHSRLGDSHAFLSPSKYHWTRWSKEKLLRAYEAAQAAREGTELHALAHSLIKKGVELPNDPRTLNLYVNDAIAFGMVSEQFLQFSDNCYGTADTILFEDGLLRIHDLKTGVTKTSVEQHYIYAALFCLEYDVNPFDIEFEFRIYQNDEVRIYEGDPDRVMHIMDTIIHFEEVIEEEKLRKRMKRKGRR